jgi:hypothetical protein
MADARMTGSKLLRFGGAAFLCLPATIGGQALGQANAAPGAPGAILITLTDSGCEPAKVDTVAGKTTFNIKNDSKRAVEWEILKDVLVVDERENSSQRLPRGLRFGHLTIRRGQCSGARSLSLADTRPRTETPASCTLSGEPDTSGCQLCRSFPSETSR